MKKTVIALYNEFSTGQQVVHELVRHSFERNDISLIANDAKGEYASTLHPTDEVGEATALGGGMGAVFGGIGGLLVGLGGMVIPGIGPVIAAGPLIGTLLGAGIGAAAGSVLGALVDLGIPEEDAHIYAESVRRGGTLVSVQTDEIRANEAMSIMKRYNPVDTKSSADRWRESGWNRFDEHAAVDIDPHHRDRYPYEASKELLITPHGGIGMYPYYFGPV